MSESLIQIRPSRAAFTKPAPVGESADAAGIAQVPPAPAQMPTEAYNALLEKQGYRFTGVHSAIKTCEWTRKSLTGKGVCYKQKFYGIRSHRCNQVSVSTNFCGLGCVFCWRERHDTPYVTVDDPVSVIDKSIAAQRKLLSGFGGNEKVNKEKFREAQEPRHWAISLTGDALSYPKLDGFIAELDRRGHSSFVVTNGQFPKVMAKMRMPTQLYISVDAPNEELLSKVDLPENKKVAWHNLVESMDVMRTLKDKTRTTIRLTCVKGLNMAEPEGYAALIRRADPWFVEVKGYVWVGASRKNLPFEAMPTHEEVRDFALDVAKHSGLQLVDEQPASKVVLLMKEDHADRIMTWAD